MAGPLPVSPQEVDQQPRDGANRRLVVIDPIDRIAEALERIAAALEHEARSAGLPLPEALSKEAAARFIGVDEATIEHLIRTRRLAYVQHGAQRGRVIAIEDLRAFLAEFRQATGEEMAGERKRA